MSLQKIRKIGVIGAGVMGHGIAEVAAIAGYEVWMSDIAEDILRKAMDRIVASLNKLYNKGKIKEEVSQIIKRIHTTTDLRRVVEDADFIIEAVPENLDLKKKIFAEADEYAPKHAILATNTSSLPISEIAESTKRPDKVIGMHFFNPPPIMKLVEVVRGKDTSDETLTTIVELAKKFGKTPVIVTRDIPGFIVNRILIRILNAACWYVYRGKATIEEVDAAMRFKLGLPMGAFELADFSGIDIFYSISKVLCDRGFIGKQCPLFEEKFKAGEYGVKVGKGFYTYPEPGKYVKPKITKEMAEKVDELEILAPAVNEAAWLLREKIATRDEIDIACELGLNYPKGVLKLADEYGIDKIVEALNKLKEETGWEEYEPDPLLKEMIKENKLGIKTEAGFYEYSGNTEKQLKTIIIKREPPIAWIILNRPEKLNAINMELLDELSNSLDEIEADNDIKVLVITGRGRAFSAGADISGFKGMQPLDALKFSRKFQEVNNKIEYLVKPVIMALNGYTLGGGIEIAMSGDFRIAAESARIGQPEINLGIMPGAGGTQRMARLIGMSKAKMLIYTGEMISAKEAYEIGLVDMVVPDDKLEEEVRKLANKLAEKPPIALLTAKYAIQYGLQTDMWSGLSMEAALFSLLFSTEDYVEGVNAFLEKRKPKFKGK